MTARSLPACSTMVGDMLDSGFLPALRGAGLQASQQPRRCCHCRAGAVSASCMAAYGTSTQLAA